MDDRFPKYLRWLVNKLDFIGLPNLGMLICGLAILGFVGTQMLGTPLDQFAFSPQAVRHGEWWRLFAFPVSAGLTNPLWLLFYVLMIYVIMNGLESHWGPGPLTVFTLFAYLCAMVGSLVTNVSTNIWHYVIENASFAFGTLFPDVEFYIYFVLPVKAKWVALFFGGVLLVQFFGSEMSGKIFLLIAMLPYFIFFGPYLVNTIYMKRKMAKHRQRFDAQDWK